MSKMLMKNTLRDIGRTKARFISIVLIIMLGVGFLVGIHSTAPSMYASAQSYYNETNLMDFRLVSTVGFTDEDVEEIKNVKGVSSVMPSYFMDVRQEGDNANIFRFIAMPEADLGERINIPNVREGRLPEKDNEIVLGYRDNEKIKIGDKISFAAPKAGEELSDSLVNTEYTVVGIVDSPLYISFERGYTNVGSGTLYNYALINGANFKIDRFTEIYLTFDDLRSYAPYSEEYTDALKAHASDLEKIGDGRVELFYSENIAPVQSSLDEAQELLNDERDKAFSELRNAEAEIKSARVELDSELKNGEAELEKAEEEIAAGEAELNDQKSLYEDGVKTAEEEFSKADAEILAGENELSAAKTTFRNTILEKLESYGVTEELLSIFIPEGEILAKEDIEKVSSLLNYYSKTLGNRITKTEETIEEIKKTADEEGREPESYPRYYIAVGTLELLNKVKDGLDEFISSELSTLLYAVGEIEDAEKKLLDAKTELQSAKDEFARECASAESKIADAEAQLAAGRLAYEQGREELESTRKTYEAELQAAQDELDKTTEEVNSKFEDAQAELDDAYEALREIPNPQWLYYDRSDNPGYSSYKDNVERVNSVGKVFPVFFMLVAVLVCVTTMSRLVEEQRGDIGALTTLGYKPMQIISKYIAYSASATVVGAIVGTVVGVLVIPAVIFNAYGILYKMPGFVLTLNVPSMIIAILVALFCTCTVTVITCFSLVRYKPATLLRPKAPKPGKRILLERITPLWKRLGFFTKVTARNIFRYKARFLMTVIGVSGCTALIFSGFGLYHSITDIVGKQFGEIFDYDTVIVAKDSDENIEELRTYIENDERMGDYALYRQGLIIVEKDREKMSENTYITVPENVEAFEKLVHLKDRKSQSKIEIETGGCVLTEKLAKSLGVGVGDYVTVTDAGVTAEVKVTGVCENYLNGYLYIDAETYEDAFGSAPEYGMFSCKFQEGVSIYEDEMSQEYISEGNTLAMTFTSSGVKSFSNMISALNYVVIVMIASAAALAFVVLYNLTNINIAERKREISTLKVLGFKNSETAAYIYRENLLLTALGTAAGLLLGIWLLNFIITTVEINMVMFGRELHFTSFLIATVLTMVFSVAVNLVMRIRLKKIDMVESLKSVE